MVTLGRTLFVMHLVFLMLAAILVFSSFGGFLGGGYMIASSLVVIVLWGAYAGLTINAIRLCYDAEHNSDRVKSWANGLFFVLMFLAPLTGLGLAFLAFIGCGPLYLPSLYHWTGMIATILGFLAYFLLPVIVRACGEDGKYAAFHSWQAVVFAPLAVAFVWGLAWLVPYLKLKDDVNLSEYKPKDHSYVLPYPGGESSWVIQGNNSSLDHNDAHFGQKYSWDFQRRCGTPLLASRGGNVSSFVDNNDGFSSGGTNNQIVVDQLDGTFAFYLHIQKGSVPSQFRASGAKVNPGDQIAKVGCVGNSLTGHIHLMVRPGAAATTTLGVSFTDVSEGSGIPRTFGSCTSGNRRVP